MTARLKVMTVIGTRPEIIRLAPTIRLLERHTDHVLVHTGQNYDFELNEVFFSELELREPDHFLHADPSNLGTQMGSILAAMHDVLSTERPDALLVLGDTNSCISAVMAKRMRVPVFHMEAGNRSFDENVPEETNRRLVDHVADYNLAYTEHGRRNLLAEGIHPSRIIVTGSPMLEALEQSRAAIQASDVLEREGLVESGFILASLHREENVDDPARLSAAMESLGALSVEFDVPVLLSTHPRTRKRLDQMTERLPQRVVLHRPFGFHDYVRLQQSAKIVLSDSGTISEEASILGFPAVTMRDAIERPEAVDVGAIVMSGLERESVVDAVRFTLANFERLGRTAIPADYRVPDTARRVVAFILSSARTHHRRAGIRISGG